MKCFKGRDLFTVIDNRLETNTLGMGERGLLLLSANSPSSQALKSSNQRTLTAFLMENAIGSISVSISFYRGTQLKSLSHILLYLSFLSRKKEN